MKRECRAHPPWSAIVTASFPCLRAVVASPMRRLCPVHASGTPARALIRFTARVTKSGTMPPVTLPCRSTPTNADASGSDQRGSASAARRARYAVHASTGQISGSSCRLIFASRTECLVLPVSTDTTRPRGVRATSPARRPAGSWAREA
jgi:hypothetical protein